MYLSKKQIQETDKINRLKIINSISGIKPGNLVGSISAGGNPNLAIISSVVHLGSNPALLGFIIRPTDRNIRRDTYENIISTKIFTINHINSHFIKNAHYTSAKFDKDVNEFQKCNLKEEYMNDFKAPFVAESNLKVGLNFIEEIPIKSNNTIMIVGEVMHLKFPDKAITEEGYIDLELLDAVGVSGLNSYYKLKKLKDYPYARVNEIPNF